MLDMQLALILLASPEAFILWCRANPKVKTPSGKSPLTTFLHACGLQDWYVAYIYVEGYRRYALVSSRMPGQATLLPFWVQVFHRKRNPHGREFHTSQRCLAALGAA